MSYWMFDVVALIVPALLLLRGRRVARRTWQATGALAAIALVWTAPWDEHLVRSGVWSYDPERVLARVGSVPAEEYGFVVLLVVLVVAWGTRTGRLPGRHGARTRGSRSTGALAWVAVAAAGAGLVVVGGTWRYLGLLLIWVAPPLALQRAVAGDLLRPRLGDRAVLALPVALWLCVADRLALADGIWVIAPDSSTGVLLLGLPLEEALFFLLTSMLVTDGLVLATDDRALGRVAVPLRRLGVRVGEAAAVPSAREGRHDLGLDAGSVVSRERCTQLLAAAGEAAALGDPLRDT